MAEGTFRFGSPLATRMEQLVNNQYFSDVVFAVGKAKEVMVAHKLILTTSSEVFNAQFSGNFVESKKEKPIELPDIEPVIFLEILRYMYCDEVNLTLDNVIDLYYGAQKYLLKSLVEVCEKFLSDSIDETNVLKIFDENRQHEFSKINELGLAIIRDNPVVIFEQQTFLNLHQRTVEMIVQCPTINCTPEQLRKATQEWIDTNEPSDNGKLLIELPARTMQCRRLSFYGNFGYTKDTKCMVDFTFGRSVSLYGLGIFIGASNWRDDLDPVTVIVDVETATCARRAVETLSVKEDLRVCKFMFGKVKIPAATKCTLAVTMKSNEMNMFYLDTLKPADCLEELSFEIQNYSINGSNTDSRTTHIAYFLYNIDF